MTMFSIVTIARNDLAGLQRTVASVNDQTCPDWEHVVVDGGSDDGSVAWLESLGQDTRRRWTSRPDRGIYDAMNSGMNRCQGKLVVFLNAGDCFAHATTLDIVMSDHEARGWNWCYGAVRYVDARGESLGGYMFDPFERRKFLMGLNWIPHATVYADLEFARNLGPYSLDYGTSGDQEWLMRAALAAPPRVLTEFLADFERGGVSQDVGPREREMIWHRMRGDVGQHWRGNRVLDRAVSEILALQKPLRIKLKRLGG